MTTSKTPTQLTSITKMLTTFAAGLISIIGLRFIGQDLIAPILMGIFLAVLMYPGFKFYRRRGASPLISLALLIISILFGLMLLITFMTWTFSLLRSSIDFELENTLTILESLPISQLLETSIANYFSPDLAINLLSSFFGNLANLILYFVIIPMLSLMILLQMDNFQSHQASSLLKHNPNLARYQKFASSIITYVFGRFKVNLLNGLCVTAGFLLLDIQFAIIWGILTIILSFIPYLGTIIAGIPPVLIALQDGIGSAVVVVIIITLANLVTENVFEPMIQGKGSRLSTPAVIVALIFWSWMLGVLGAIMAVPLTVLLKTVLADYSETSWIAAIMEGNYSLPSNEESNSLINRLSSTLSGIIPKRK